MATQPLERADALREAGRYSLIKCDAPNRTIEIHRLVQAVVQDGMDEPARGLWAERVVRA